MNEEWRDISGYEGLYQVSNLGRVKSLPEPRRNDGRFTRKGEIMKLTPRSRKRQNEYLCVGINRRLHAVHRLVASAFIPKVKGKTMVNHKNGNKQDNKVSNLEWSDSGDNNRHAYATGLNKHRIQDFAVRKLTQKQISYVCTYLDETCDKLAKKFNVSRSCISKIRRKFGINIRLRKKLSNHS